MIRQWMRRIPFLRVYGALDDVRAQARKLKGEVVALRDELQRAKEATRQRELALRFATPLMSTLVEPAIDEDRLGAIVRESAETYRTAQPFPHIVVDDLFRPRILEQVLDEFNAMERGGWHHSDAGHERKWSTEDPRRLGPYTSALIAQLNAGPFVSFLEALTGITGLLPDPHLRGGGLHEIRQGGLLGVHADFNVHPRLKAYRRLNLLIYLNKDWQDEWGGALELWDRGGTRCERKVQPVFNRAVLFDTSNFSYHGHPHPLACPPERSRKSVALYYYSVEYTAAEDRAAHGTVFLETSK